MVQNKRRRFVLLSLLLIQASASLLQSRPASIPGVLRLAVADAETAPAERMTPMDSYRLALLKMKGHLGVARTLLQVRQPGAEYQLQQPIREIFHSIESDLERRSAPLTTDTLVQLERAASVEPRAALATIDSAAAAIDGSFAQTGGLDAPSALALSEALLREAVGAYADAVVDNEVVDVQTYHRGRGFVVQAEALVRHASGLKGSPGQDALIAAVVLIRQAWPGVVPPPIVFDPESVAGRLDEAVAAMDQVGD